MLSAIVRLVATGDAVAPCEIQLSAFPVRVGRRAGVGIFLPDRWVSRDHCEIDCLEDSLTVRDLGSRHGTYVNGHSVAASPLNSGDQLSVGLTTFVVRYEHVPSSAARPVSV